MIGQYQALQNGLRPSARRDSGADGAVQGGGNAMLWTAEPWTDTPSDQADETLDRILAVLSEDVSEPPPAGSSTSLVWAIGKWTGRT